MSHHGIGLLFAPGEETGYIRLLHIHDVELVCPACRHDTVVRRYNDHPFHRITAHWLQHALDQGPRLAGPTPCPTCDHPLQAEDIRRWTFHHGFPDGTGVLQGLAHRDGRRRWSPADFPILDPQQTLAWIDARPDDPPGPWQHRPHLTGPLTEQAVVALLGRPLSGKALARAALRRLAPGGGDLPCFLDLGPNLHAGFLPISAGDEAVAGLWAHHRRTTPLPDGLWVHAVLGDADHLAAGFDGAAEAWLSDMRPHLAAAGARLHAWALADAVGPALDAIVSRFPIPCRMEALDLDTLWLRAPGMRDPDLAPQIVPADVAAEAARSLSQPTDIARLEIDRILHALTGWYGEAPDAERPDRMDDEDQALYRAHVPTCPAGAEQRARRAPDPS
jgi:hypothetical protein